MALFSGMVGYITVGFLARDISSDGFQFGYYMAVSAAVGIMGKDQIKLLDTLASRVSLLFTGGDHERKR